MLQLVAPGVHAYILRHRLYRKVNWAMVRERAEGVKEIVRRESDERDKGGDVNAPATRKV